MGLGLPPPKNIGVPLKGNTGAIQVLGFRGFLKVKSCPDKVHLAEVALCLEGCRRLAHVHLRSDLFGG